LFFQRYLWKKFIAKDINKIYISNLINIKFILVFNQFDTFVEYNQEKITDYSIYFVEKVEDIIKY
jgi:hypothetical protein